MEIPAQPTTQPGTAERVARGAVLVFLGLSSLTLAFGLGFGLKELDDDGAVAATGAPPAASTAVPAASGSALTPTINEIINLLKTEYVDRKSVDEKFLQTSAISGLIASLNDRETSYISPEDLKKGALDLNSSYQGIGASVSGRSGQVQIVAPFRDSPAEKAGIRSGDVILEVDGESAEGWSDAQAVERIRGPKGTPVTIKVKHTDGVTETITVTRGDIQIESVFTDPHLEIVPGETGTRFVDRAGKDVTDLGYINITQFHDQTTKELLAKASDFESRGYKGIILDMRSNPGGLLSTTVETADQFLSSGTIITEVDANGKQSSTTAKPGGILTRLPIVVLMDKGSASGSEVLAAALRDNGRAKILGTTSYGKGTVNRQFPLRSCGQAPPACGAVYMAIGRWLTPKGELIEGLGVTADIELPMTADQYLEQGDIQLFKAIELLRGQ